MEKDLDKNKLDKLIKLFIPSGILVSEDDPRLNAAENARLNHLKEVFTWPYYSSERKNKKRIYSKTPEIYRPMFG